jgi:hypothetical protein
MPAHKHAALIKAWADGVAIQRKNVFTNEWVDTDVPGWVEYNEYRIKPETKPDVVKYGTFDKGVMYFFASRYDQDSVKFTFDGETGKIKSVELIKE